MVICLSLHTVHKEVISYPPDRHCFAGPWVTSVYDPEVAVSFSGGSFSRNFAGPDCQCGVVFNFFEKTYSGLHE